MLLRNYCRLEFFYGGQSLEGQLNSNTRCTTTYRQNPVELNYCVFRNLG